MLINPDDVLNVLNYDVKWRTKVEFLLEWVQQRAETIIRRKLDKADYTWLLDGNDTTRVRLPVLPINSTTGVYVDYSRVFATAVNTSEYYVDEDAGILEFYNLKPDGVRVVKVVANAGYDEDSFPADLKMAFIEAVGWNMNRITDKSFGIRQQATPDGLTTGYEMVLPLGVQRVFEMYRDRL